MLTHRRFIIFECLTLTLIIPLAMTLWGQPRIMFGVLWLVSVYGWWVLGKTSEKRRMGWDFSALNARSLIRPLLVRFALCAALLSAVVMALYPERLLSFPSQRPLIWSLVMVGYPLLSVIPQEFIFRRFFFERYASIFSRPETMIWASALTFGLAHMFLHNWVAPALSTIGGLFFARTYARSRSMALVCAEHALYGCFIFTIGLGFFFYSGAPHKW